MWLLFLILLGTLEAADALVYQHKLPEQEFNFSIQSGARLAVSKESLRTREDAVTAAAPILPTVPASPYFQYEDLPLVKGIFAWAEILSDGILMPPIYQHHFLRFMKEFSYPSFCDDKAATEIPLAILAYYYRGDLDKKTFEIFQKWSGNTGTPPLLQQKINFYKAMMRYQNRTGEISDQEAFELFEEVLQELPRASDEGERKAYYKVNDDARACYYQARLLQQQRVNAQESAQEIFERLLRMRGVTSNILYKNTIRRAREHFDNEWGYSDHPKYQRILGDLHKVELGDVNTYTLPRQYIKDLSKEMRVSPFMQERALCCANTSNLVPEYIKNQARLYTVLIRDFPSMEGFSEKILFKSLHYLQDLSSCREQDRARAHLYLGIAALKYEYKDSYELFTIVQYSVRVHSKDRWLAKYYRAWIKYHKNYKKMATYEAQEIFFSVLRESSLDGMHKLHAAFYLWKMMVQKRLKLLDEEALEVFNKLYESPDLGEKDKVRIVFEMIECLKTGEIISNGQVSLGELYAFIRQNPASTYKQKIKAFFDSINI